MVSAIEAHVHVHRLYAHVGRVHVHPVAHHVGIGVHVAALDHVSGDVAAAIVGGWEAQDTVIMSWLVASAITFIGMPGIVGRSPNIPSMAVTSSDLVIDED